MRRLCVHLLLLALLLGVTWEEKVSATAEPVRLTHSELCGLVFHQSSRPLEHALRTGVIVLSPEQEHFLIRLFKDEIFERPEGSAWSRKLVAILGARFYRLALHTAARLEQTPGIRWRVDTSGIRNIREEAINEAFIAFPQILKNYDLDRGVKFSSYFLVQLRYRFKVAYAVVSTGNSYRLDSNVARLNRRVRELNFEAEAEGKTLSNQELVSLLGVEFPGLHQESLQKMLIAHGLYETQNWTRLDTPILSNDGESQTRAALLTNELPTEEGELGHLLGERAEATYFKEQVLLPFRRHLQEALDSAPKTLKREIKLYERLIFIWDHRMFSETPMSVVEIAEHFGGLSRQRVQQLEAALLNHLKAYIEERGFDMSGEE